VDIADTFSVKARRHFSEWRVRISHEVVDLKTRYPFVIARGGYAAHENVVVKITDSDGIEGLGEAAPNRYYGESVATVISALEQFAPVLGAADAWSLEATDEALSRVLRGNNAAKSAISSALHDIVGKRLGIPVYRLWGLDAADAGESSFTIGIADNEGLRQRVADAAQYPILKVKLGTDRDMEIVRVVRDAAPNKRLRVDANAAWTASHAVRMIDFLADNDVEYVEQRTLRTGDVDVIQVDADTGIDAPQRIGLADATDVGGGGAAGAARGIDGQVGHLRIEIADILDVQLVQRL
jgi:L-alanine-DL-glutamate epimerase-like enolase superfamily enzyme